MSGPELNQGSEDQNASFDMAEKKAATKAMLEAPVVVLSEEERAAEKSEKAPEGNSVFRMDEDGHLTTDRHLPDMFEATDEDKKEIATCFLSLKHLSAEEIRAMTIDEIRSKFAMLPKNFNLSDIDSIDEALYQQGLEEIDGNAKMNIVMDKLSSDCFLRMNTEAKLHFESGDLSVENGAYIMQNLGYERTRLEIAAERGQEYNNQLTELLRMELDYLRERSFKLTEKDETELDENYDYDRPGFRYEAFRVLDKALSMDDTRDEALSVFAAALGKHELSEEEIAAMTDFIAVVFSASDRKIDVINLGQSVEYASSILENPSDFEKFKEEKPGEVGIVMCTSEKTRAKGLELLGKHLGDAIEEQLVQGDPGVEDSEIDERREQIVESLKSISASAGESAIHYLKYLQRSTEGSEVFQLLLALEETGTLDLARMDEKNQFIPGFVIRALDYTIGRSPQNDEYFDQLIKNVGHYRYNVDTNNVYCYCELREIERGTSEHPDGGNIQGRVFSQMLSSQVEYIRARSRNAVEGIIGEDITQKIDHFVEKYGKLLRKREIVASNVEMIIQLEGSQPGITEFLEKEQGIEDFGRYPLELLLDQYRLRDDEDKPYGVILNPRSDHNGAFHWAERMVYPGLYEQLKSLGYNLRIIEAGSKFEIGRNLLKLDRKHADKNTATPHKISFAFIGGHGSEGSIQFGQDGYNFSARENQALQLQDLIGRGVQRAFGKQFFEEGATIVLQSCSTGKLETESGEHGIGRQISEISGAYLIAPNIPSNFRNIDVEMGSDHRLHFNVDFWDKDEDMHYAAGQYVPQSGEENPNN